MTADELSATVSNNPALIGLEPEAVWRYWRLLVGVVDELSAA